MIDSDRYKIENIRQVVLQWASQQGHNKCWYYPDLFNELIEILGIKPNEYIPTNQTLPSVEEFKKGCERYQRDLYDRK